VRSYRPNLPGPRPTAQHSISDEATADLQSRSQSHTNRRYERRPHAHRRSVDDSRLIHPRCWPAILCGLANYQSCYLELVPSRSGLIQHLYTQHAAWRLRCKPDAELKQPVDALPSAGLMGVDPPFITYAARTAAEQCHSLPEGEAYAGIWDPLEYMGSTRYVGLARVCGIRPATEQPLGSPAINGVYIARACRS
jgi:hypothetical protein